MGQGDGITMGTGGVCGGSTAPQELSFPGTHLTVRQEAGTSVRMTCSGLGAAPALPGTLQTPQW